MKKKSPGRPFVKGDPRINRAGSPPGGMPGAGRPSELHRAQCRALIEKYGLRDWVAKVAKGDNEEVYMAPFGGKVKKIPANVNNRIKAIVYLSEQGFGLAPRDSSPAQGAISPAKLAKFENAFLAVLQKFVPASVHSTDLVQAVMDCSAILLEPEEDPDADR